MDNYKQMKKIERIVVLCMMAFVCVFVFAVYSIASIGKARRTNAEYDSMIASLQAKKDKLEEDKKQLEDENFIKSTAEDGYGLIGEDETYYVFK